MPVHLGCHVVELLTVGAAFKFSLPVYITHSSPWVRQNYAACLLRTRTRCLVPSCMHTMLAQKRNCLHNSKRGASAETLVSHALVKCHFER